MVLTLLVVMMGFKNPKTKLKLSLKARKVSILHFAFSSLLAYEHLLTYFIISAAPATNQQTDQASKSGASDEQSSKTQEGAANQTTSSDDKSATMNNEQSEAAQTMDASPSPSPSPFSLLDSVSIWSLGF